ncbi:unnamed protein product [Symbiodinium sp. CCMP2592]|nr:unnamed protein product [Symbiodinium sp. CCMP2592]
MPDAWDKFGKTVEVSGEGMVLTKTTGGNYSRHAAAKELLTSGVHTWEVELTSGAIQNNNRDMFIGVAAPGCDVEKGDHHDKGKAWYLRTHDGNIYGGDIDTEDAAKKGKFFVVGDRVGLRLDCNDGSLCFYKNGEPFGEPRSVLGILFLLWFEEQFPPGTISMPVVRAVELKCNGQSVTLFPQAQLA